VMVVVHREGRDPVAFLHPHLFERPRKLARIARDSRPIGALDSPVRPGGNELARAVLAELHVAAEVEAAMSAGFQTAARRPLNGCLASSRVAAMRPWREGLHDWAARRAADPAKA